MGKRVVALAVTAPETPEPTLSPILPPTMALMESATESPRVEELIIASESSVVVFETPQPTPSPTLPPTLAPTESPSINFAESATLEKFEELVVVSAEVAFETPQPTPATTNPPILVPTESPTETTTLERVEDLAVAS